MQDRVDDPEQRWAGENNKFVIERTGAKAPEEVKTRNVDRVELHIMQPRQPSDLRIDRILRAKR